jgi:hypothetical protein
MKLPIIVVWEFTFRYLTVFRDLQQSEGGPSVPTEWNGEKDKTKPEVNTSTQLINIYFICFFE